jgi:hypothetical protein
VCVCECVQFICLLRKTSSVDTPMYETHLIAANEL